MAQERCNRKRKFCLLWLVAGGILLWSGCSGQGGNLNSPKVQGVGATFPNPLYQKWIDVYSESHPEARIDYQSIGSGAGIKQLLEQTVDFGASDVPMSDADLSSAPGPILHIPTALGAVVVTYNLPGVEQPLRFSPNTLAKIYLGQIRRWDDPLIQADNPQVLLPAADIVVVHRAEASGTSAVFTDYLAKVNAEWQTEFGRSLAPKWPVGFGGKGNEGVTGQVKQTPHTIAYTELIYALSNDLPVAWIKNRAGVFVAPSLSSVTAAATDAAPRTAADMRASLTDAGGPDSYPIASYTYLLVYREQKSAVKAKALTDFLWWGLHEGSPYAAKLHYATLPQPVVETGAALINSITCQGRKVR